jgi:hypothetical protein
MKKAFLSWPALLLSPLLALGNLTITFALVTPSCANQQHDSLHIVTASSILISVIFTVMAAYASAINRPIAKAPDDEVTIRPHFLTSLSFWTGIFFTLTLLAEWIGQWLLSPCL